MRLRGDVSADAPAFHIAHGSDDRLVPPGQSRDLAAALQRLGVPVEHHIVDGAGHLWAGADDPGALLDAAIAFARSAVR